MFYHYAQYASKMPRTLKGNDQQVSNQGVIPSTVQLLFPLSNTKQLQKIHLLWSLSSHWKLPFSFMLLAVDQTSSFLTMQRKHRVSEKVHRIQGQFCSLVKVQGLLLLPSVVSDVSLSIFTTIPVLSLTFFSKCNKILGAAILPRFWNSEQY